LRPELETPLWNHIHDLRGTIIRFLLILFLGFIVALYFYPTIMSFLNPKIGSTPLTLEKIERHQIKNQDSIPYFYSFTTDTKIIFASEKTKEITPYQYEILPGGIIKYEKYINNPQLIILGPLEGFLTTFKVCFWVSLAVTAPLWGFVLLRFILPGLHEGEIKWIPPFFAGSFIFIFLGFLLAFWFTIPLANSYFLLFNNEIGINLWSLSHYIDYTLTLVLGHAVAFELCFLLIFLVHLGWISSEWLMDKRRIMIVLAFVLGAILTPPDVLTQFMLAIPLVIIYEITIFYSKRIKRCKPNFK
jgi:sec-independent protein translocase protein TatC